MLCTLIVCFGAEPGSRPCTIVISHPNRCKRWCGLNSGRHGSSRCTCVVCHVMSRHFIVLTLILVGAIVPHGLANMVDPHAVPNPGEEAEPNARDDVRLPLAVVVETYDASWVQGVGAPLYAMLLARGSRPVRQTLC